MSWFRIDDGFWGHEKVTELSDAALALWVQAGSWTARYRRDGSVPRDIFKRLGRKKAAIQELIEAGLWVETSDGYAFHDFAEWQPQIARAEETREQAAERQRKSRMSRVTAEERHETPPDPITRDPVTRARSPSPILTDPNQPIPTAGVRVREGEAPPEWEAQAYASSVPTRFRKLHMARFNVDPAVGGRNASDFPERLRNTAQARSLDPLALLEELFARWADAGRPGTEGGVPPYPAFIARFESLVAPTVAKAGTSPQARLKELSARQRELMTAGNFGEEFDDVSKQIREAQGEVDREEQRYARR
ncbi:MAG TPA: hypothetical protein VFZ61_03780 [Polyangiales bacterium]